MNNGTIKMVKMKFPYISANTIKFNYISYKVNKMIV